MSTHTHDTKPATGEGPHDVEDDHSVPPGLEKLGALSWRCPASKRHPSAWPRPCSRSGQTDASALPQLLESARSGVRSLVVFDTSGHRPLWEQPDEFVDHMTNTVLARTSATG